MMNITRWSEVDFFQWLRIQLEKRELVQGKCPKKVREELYEILFDEQGITVEDIERFFIPFGQAGYLTTRQKFEIILFILEKDYGSSFLFLEDVENCYTVTKEEIEDIYLQWSQEERIFLSEEEKKEFFVQNIMDGLGLGVLEVLKRVAPDGIFLGELCPAFFEKEIPEERVAVYSRGAVIRLPFLAVESREELIRIIRCVIALEHKAELTMLNPMLDFVREDGTCITAIRPPAGKDWGMRILYGAAKREGMYWKK